MNDDNALMTDEQRRILLNFAEKLDVFATVTRNMRQARTVGEAKRLIQQVDDLAEALASTIS